MSVLELRTELQRHNALASAVRDTARREGGCFYSERSGFQEPVYNIFFAFFVLFNVVGTHETFENEDLLPVGPQFGGLL